MVGTIALLIAFNLGYAAYVSAQSVISADVNIVSAQAEITPDNHFVCTAVINNQNDDDAFGTKVVVLLPLQVKITAMSGKCTRSALQDGFNGYATCDLSHLPQGPNVLRTIKITTTKSTAAASYPHTCSAFVYSLRGDIEKKNNYATATAP